MCRFVRQLTILAVCGMAMLCSACGGSTKDKLVGKWKMEPKDDQKAAMADGKLAMVMEFTKDGTFKIGLDVTDPAEKEKMGKFAEMFSFTGKYNVNGDTLELVPADDKDKNGPFKKGENKAKIKFEGKDKVILTGVGEGSKDVTLTRMN